MLGPNAHTHPAKLMLTLPTCHVVAAPILLDRGVAPRAFLSVRGDPVSSLGVILAFLEPFFDQRTRSWLMVRECAAEAEVVVIGALYGRDDPVEVSVLDGTINRIYAVWRWTPFEVVLVIDVRSRQEFLVPRASVSPSVGRCR